MKKTILSTVLGLAMTGAAFAQGYVNWGIPNTDVTVQTNTTAFSPLFNSAGATLPASQTVGLTTTVAGSFYYALLTSPSPSGALSTDTAVWDGTWTGATGNGGTPMTGTNSTGLSHGAVVVGSVNGQSGSGVQVSWANGTTNNTILVGWSANLGTSWVVVSNELANWSTTYASTFIGQNVFFGETSIGNVNPASASPGNGIFGINNTPTSTGTPIFSLNTQLYLLPTSVPEPSTIALAGLGGLSMLLFRRKK